MVLRVLLPIAAALSCAAAFNPALSLCELENGFDYVGGDIENVPNRCYDACCGECFARPDKCFAWSWNNYKNGTCWLKSGYTSIVVNPNVKSARWTYAPYGLDSCYLYTDVDFYGNDIGNQKATKAEDCCQICRNTLGCRAYSWSDYQGGTCWLKSKRGDQVLFKTGVKSADAYTTGSPFREGGFYAMEPGVDYVGNDLANVQGKPLSECGYLCHVQANCTAFSWNNYQGGTCWLKSGRGKTTPNAGVTSGVHKQSKSPMYYP